jgi:hypothetical protein
VIVYIIYLNNFDKNRTKKSRLMRQPCCLCIPFYQFVNVWTNLYETWYVYHGTWAHLSIILHTTLLSVCVSILSSHQCYVTAW